MKRWEVAAQAPPSVAFGVAVSDPALMVAPLPIRCSQRFCQRVLGIGAFLVVTGQLCSCATDAPPAPQVVVEKEPAIKPPPPLEASTPIKEGIDVEALRVLVDRAERTKTSALVVLRHGRLVGSWSFDGSDVRAPLETANMTPSIVALGIAVLVEDGELTYDDTLDQFSPELKGQPAGVIRIRHLMTHTSGLPALHTSEIYGAADVVKLALERPLRHRPGRKFEYNNSAVNLLPEIARRKTGKEFDHLLDRRVLLPMGIRRGAWGRDKTDHLYAMSNLEISAVDLAKIGWMLAESGVYQRRRILKRESVNTLLRPQRGLPNFGRLWWMAYPNAVREVTPEGITALEDKNLDPTIVEALRDIQGDKIPEAEFDRFV